MFAYEETDRWRERIRQVQERFLAHRADLIVERGAEGAGEVLAQARWQLAELIPRMLRRVLVVASRSAVVR